MTAFQSLKRSFSRWTIDFEPARKSYWNGFYWRTRSFELAVDRKSWMNLGLALLKFHENWSLLISLLGIRAYIKLPFPVKSEPDDMLDKWGFDFGGLTESGVPTDLVFEWGPEKRKSFYMPWMWEHYKSEVRNADGNWEIQVASYERDKTPDKRLVKTFPYRYVTNSGDIQDVLADVYETKRELRWRALKKLPWPARIERSIEVRFSEGVGEGRGSWKGGCTGCGWEIKSGQTMEEALRDMEKNRRFSR